MTLLTAPLGTALPHSSSLIASSLNSVAYSSSRAASVLDSNLLHSSTILHAAPMAAGALIAAAWQGVILVSLVALALRLLPRLSATVRSLIWTAVLALAVLLPLLSFATHTAPTHTAATPHATLHLPETWSFALAALWAAISLFKLVQLARSAWHLAAISRRAVEVDREDLSSLDPNISVLLHEGRRQPRLCISDEVDRPCVAGFLSPRILLPVGLLERVTPLELEQILRHEREHLNRSDDWINLAQKLALALFPLNPALLFIERQLCTERELACDDTVLRETHAAKAYALCLANLAEMSLARKSALLALAAWQKRSELARRVERILLPSVAAMPRRAAATAGALVTMLAIGSAATLAHAPALVSFVPAMPSANTLAANDLQVVPPTQSFASRMSPVTPAATSMAFPVGANTPGMRRAHATSLLMTLPAKRITARPVTVTLGKKPAHHAPVAREIAALDPPHLQQPAEATLVRQVIDPEEGTITSWYVVASYDALGSSQPAAAQPVQQPRRQPHYVPTYAAFATPAGWLVVEM
ncbi:Signal transducer regulating beta-lactamase production, contains metallopeptidase domain [Bryocella elongata]|uniref:Signal transducer regulating beta-lactamase production, contains metallopeptidase domain n=1 Tax=Bryocella elongata TaxID=863522 RepID=A0A1H6A2G6_9BACT|nr:M56 family metallopeptidase [Bryocella elongata]SEG42953.1 Signal transducer regulating beta-lactamase production, contains metallopeptidase domain [Bryocella elongata]